MTRWVLLLGGLTAAAGWVLTPLVALTCHGSLTDQAVRAWRDETRSPR